MSYGVHRVVLWRAYRIHACMVLLVKVTRPVGRTLNPVFSPLGKVETQSDASRERCYCCSIQGPSNTTILVGCAPLALEKLGSEFCLRGCVFLLSWLRYTVLLCRSFERRNIGGGLFSLAVLQGVRAGGRDGERRFNHSGVGGFAGSYCSNA